MPLHVAVALANVGHGAQEAPHEVTLELLAQAAPHRWKLVLQATPQTPVVHVDAPFAGTGQTVPQLPQFVMSVAGVTSHPFAALPSQSE